MSEVAVAETPEVVTPDSTAVTPERVAVPEPPSVETPAPDSAPPETRGTETPEAAPEPEAEPPASTPEARLAQLDAKIERGETLSAAEARELKSVQQSVADRRANYNAFIEKQRQAQAEKQELSHKAHSGLYWNALKHAEALDGTTASFELFKERLWRDIHNLSASQQTVQQQEVHSFLDSELLKDYGETPQNYEALAAMSWQQKVERLTEKRQQLARENGYGPEAVVLKTAAEKKAYDEKVIKSYVDGQKAGNPELIAQTGTGGRSLPQRGMTLDQIERMPMSEWQAIPREERQRILDDAHIKAGR